eukprot:13552804-Alexandrium_andersonii.AAC.1
MIISLFLSSFFLSVLSPSAAPGATSPARPHPKARPKRVNIHWAVGGGWRAGEALGTPEGE